jgi:hypothetical protein
MKKRYQDGGIIGNSNYPFGQYQGGGSAPSTTPDTGLGNAAPLVQVNTQQPIQPLSGADSEPTGMRKGGKVKAKKMSSGGYRKVADGAAKRGKTKGRMV